MIIIPENGAYDQRPLTDVPYFDAPKDVTVPRWMREHPAREEIAAYHRHSEELSTPGQKCDSSSHYGNSGSRAKDAYNEYLQLKRDNAQSRVMKINTRAFLRSRQAMNPSLSSGRYEVTIYRDMFRVKAISVPPSRFASLGDKIRGPVKGFSRRSRKRLIELMASTRFDGDMVFLTMTYSDEMAFRYDLHHAHFEALRRRIERMSDKVSVIWRKEMRERKSGKYQGKVAPHYHLLIYIHDGFDMSSILLPDGSRVLNNPDVKLNPKSDGKHSELSSLIEGWALAHWYEIVASGNEHHSYRGAHCRLVKSQRHAEYYAAKYLAKEETDDFEVGRRWGKIGHFDTSPFMRIRLEGDEYIEFRRIVSRLLKSRNSKYWRRFTRMSPDVGCTVFGLGDSSCDIWRDGFESTVLRMIMSVKYHT